MRILLKTLLCLIVFSVTAGATGVSLSQDERVFRMSNGRLSVVIDKHSARITSVALGGRELLGGGTGYWSMSSFAGRNRVGGFGSSTEQSVAIDPAANGGARAEVACWFRGTGADGAFPGRVEVRYSMGRDASVLHASAVLSHGTGDAPFRLGEGRFVIKVDPDVFNHLSIDRNRDRDMPTGFDWDQGRQLNLKEVRRLTTGKYASSAEHKYAYSAILADVPAYGWCGTRQPFGVWMINPAIEYLAGGPTKMELTGHLDVGEGGRPTLLNMWHGSHYGGTVLSLRQDEDWTKVIGPFAIHFNHGGTPGELWNAASQQASIEKQAWPYPWFRHDAYPPAGARGGISGKLRVVSTSPDDQPLKEIQIGLTQASNWGGAQESIEWQRDGRNYQYWTRCGADGAFKLTHARPGNYVLRAFADGVWGEFARAVVTVKAGAVIDLGEIPWTPDRSGPTLWQIGTPDRSAAEFRNGDRFWEWGNYLRYKTDFPNGVDYTVGKSDWSKDWHICQPLDLSPGCEVLGDSVWTVRFPLDRVPGAGLRLRVAFCGSRGGARWSVDLNGRNVRPAESLPENGVMHRDSHRGMSFERSFGMPAADLNAGENILRFRLSGSVWHQGVLYDCIRMEELESAAGRVSRAD